MSLPTNKTDGYVLSPDEGDAHAFFGGGRFVIKATADQTGASLRLPNGGVQEVSGRPSMSTATTTNSS
jgi:hypothetical protein